jgi:hypothetical protein
LITPVTGELDGQDRSAVRMITFASADGCSIPVGLMPGAVTVRDRCAGPSSGCRD